MLELARRAAHAAASGTGVITGSVTGFDGVPLAGACVTAVGITGVGAGHSITAAAAPDGAFRLADLTAGSYALEYRDCAAPGRYLTAWSGGADRPTTAARVLVAAGQVRRVPVMMLRPLHTAAALRASQASWHRMLANATGRGLSAAASAKAGQIAGEVTGKGRPLRGICVIVFPIKGGIGYGTTTGKHGTYVVRHLPPGRYSVSFAGPFCSNSGNWLPQTYRNKNSPFGPTPTPVTVRSGKQTGGIDARLRLGGEISGIVTSKSGRGLGGICVSSSVSFHGGIIGLSLGTAPSGTYHLHALVPGKYTVSFSVGCGSKGNYAPATRRVRVGSGQDIAGIDAALGTGGSISGTVTLGQAAGRTLAGICVTAISDNGSIFVTGATDRDGEYTVVGLVTGRYSLEFQAGCDNQGNYTSVFASARAVTGKRTTGVNAVLQRGGTISGVVTDNRGRPVYGICITLGGADAYTAELPESTDTNGSYAITGLSAGTYQVGFSGGCGNSGDYAAVWYQDQPSQTAATSIRLTTAEAVTDIDQQLAPGATITGKVTDASGHPLSGICVDATTPSEAELGPVFTQNSFTQDGTYSISGLTPGQYLVEFGCGLNTTYADQWFHAGPDSGSAELISAGPGRTSGINAVLQTAGSIRGVVTGTAGHPLAGVCVSALSASGFLVNLDDPYGPGTPITGSHGAYKISGLAPGSYDVSFTPCAGSLQYAERWYRGAASPLSATAVRVRAGKTTSGIDGRLVVGGTISGRVVNASGKPLRNICILAFSDQTSSYGFASTGKAGTYTTRGLGTGRYTVQFTPCLNQNLVTVTRRSRVTAPHRTSGVDATMRAGGSIAGVVTAGSASGPPVSGTCVEAIPANPSNSSFGAAVTGTDGSYLATGLAAGTYQVYFNDPGCFFAAPGLAPQWYNGKQTEESATPVQVQIGQTTQAIDAALQPDGEITGTVSGPSASPLAGACVTAVQLSPGGLPPVVAVSKASGYALIQLPPGRYKVRFSAGCGATGYAAQWWKNATSQKAGKVITILPGKTHAAISATLSKS